MKRKRTTRICPMTQRASPQRIPPRGKMKRKRTTRICPMTQRASPQRISPAREDEAEADDPHLSDDTANESATDSPAREDEDEAEAEPEAEPDGPEDWESFAHLSGDEVFRQLKTHRVIEDFAQPRGVAAPDAPVATRARSLFQNARQAV